MCAFPHLSNGTHLQRGAGFDQGGLACILDTYQAVECSCPSSFRNWDFIWCATCESTRNDCPDFIQSPSWAKVLFVSGGWARHQTCWRAVPGQTGPDSLSACAGMQAVVIWLQMERGLILYQRWPPPPCSMLIWFWAIWSLSVSEPSSQVVGVFTQLKLKSTPGWAWETSQPGLRFVIYLLFPASWANKLTNVPHD